MKSTVGGTFINLDVRTSGTTVHVSTAWSSVIPVARKIP